MRTQIAVNISSCFTHLHKLPLKRDTEGARLGAINADSNLGDHRNVFRGHRERVWSTTYYGGPEDWADPGDERRF
jgi:hypothetical protein